MSAKYYCDGCNKEMPAGEHGRLRRKLGNIGVEIIHSVEKVWNAGHVCHACLIATVKDGVEMDQSGGLIER